MFSKVNWEPSLANQAFSSIQLRLVLQEGEGPHSPSSSLTAGSGSNGESVWTCLCHQHTGPLPGLCTLLLDREVSQRNVEKLITSRQGAKPSYSPNRAGLAPSP